MREDQLSPACNLGGFPGHASTWLHGRGFLILNMAKLSYSEKLKDPRWQQKRLKLFEAAGWQCEWCDSKTNTLTVHHGFYAGLDPWDYEDATLHVICDLCHQEAQIDLTATQRMIALLPLDSVEHLPEVLKGIFLISRRIYRDSDSLNQGWEIAMETEGDRKIAFRSERLRRKHKANEKDAA